REEGLITGMAVLAQPLEFQEDCLLRSLLSDLGGVIHQQESVMLNPAASIAGKGLSKREPACVPIRWGFRRPATNGQAVSGTRRPGCCTAPSTGRPWPSAHRACRPPPAGPRRARR